MIFPELAPGDNKDLAAAGAGMLQALLAAHQAGWVSRETAMRLFYGAIGEEINVEEELARVAGERPP